MKIVLENLTKIFPNRIKGKNDVVAVKDMSFEIPDGKLVGVLGPSGCGKSTFLNLISGLEEPTSGRIFFDEEDITDVKPEDRDIGMVFQNYALYPHLTVKENIMLPLECLEGKEKPGKEKIEERAIEIAKLVQVDDCLDRKPSKLSGGQQQRVAIARALVKMPKVLLLDEPLSNLDARLRIKTREEIRRIQKETGITTIFVTHDQEEAMSISDVIILMKEGTVQQIGKPQDVYDEPENLFVASFLGTPAINLFDGKIVEKKLYIGEDFIMDYNTEDKEVIVGIRPEGLIVDKNGCFKCALDRREILGKDHSVVCHHKNSVSNADVKAIISSETVIKEDIKEIKFSIKPEKIYIFDKDSEERC